VKLVICLQTPASEATQPAATTAVVVVLRATASNCRTLPAQIMLSVVIVGLFLPAAADNVRKKRAEISWRSALILSFCC
jgi:hypothetical protein